jgi:hypothetical protein
MGHVCGGFNTLRIELLHELRIEFADGGVDPKPSE